MPSDWAWLMENVLSHTLCHAVFIFYIYIEFIFLYLFNNRVFTCQVSARKLKPHPPRPRSLHERLLEDIKAERKLRPVSPDMIRRSRLGKMTTTKHIAVLMCVCCCRCNPMKHCNAPQAMTWKLTVTWTLVKIIFDLCMPALCEPFQFTEYNINHVLIILNCIHCSYSDNPLPISASHFM